MQKRFCFGSMAECVKAAAAGRLPWLEQTLDYSFLTWLSKNYTTQCHGYCAFSREAFTWFPNGGNIGLE
jgi:hypothetical protein